MDSDKKYIPGLPNAGEPEKKLTKNQKRNKNKKKGKQNTDNRSEADSKSISSGSSRPSPIKNDTTIANSTDGKTTANVKSKVEETAKDNKSTKEVHEENVHTAASDTYQAVGKDIIQTKSADGQETETVNSWESLETKSENSIAATNECSDQSSYNLITSQANDDLVQTKLESLLVEDTADNKAKDSALLQPEQHSEERENMHRQSKNRDRSRSNDRGNDTRRQQGQYGDAHHRDRQQRSGRLGDEASSQRFQGDRQGKSGGSKKKKGKQTPVSNIPGLGPAVSGNNQPDSSQNNRFHGQSTQQPPADEGDHRHRKLATDMAYKIKNPRVANLETYDGYVYTDKLAENLKIGEQLLNMIASKFDAEFETMFDDYGRGNIRMKRSRRREDDPDFNLSKKLSSLLRHRAEDKGFKLLEGGFLFVEDILRRGEFRGFDEAAVQRVVRDNDKQRFKLETDEKTQKLKIRANQGHSMKIDNLELRTVTSKDVPVCVHGTNYEAWKLIQSSGLRTMGRNHIHFAPGEPGESGVISGMRASCHVLVYIDMDKAIADGIKFEMSANKVILSEGDKRNMIGPEYFKEVRDRKTRKLLFLPKDNAAKKTDASNGGGATSSKNTDASSKKNQSENQQLREKSAGGASS